MRRTGVIRFTLPILVCLSAIACTKSRPANDPSTTSPPAEQAPSAPAVENTASGEDSDMQFAEPEDKGEATERTPPPTKSWKPLDKEKPPKNARQPADEKAGK
jgi:hypothetical protein